MNTANIHTFRLQMSFHTTETTHIHPTETFAGKLTTPFIFYLFQECIHIGKIRILFQRSITNTTDRIVTGNIYDARPGSHPGNYKMHFCQTDN